MKNNKVTVYVGGRRFVLVSPESEEYMKNVAKRVNEKITSIAKNFSQLDARGCAIMAALDLADDEQKALGKKAELVHQADKVLKQADRQSKQIIEMKKQYSELDKKYDELLEQFEDLKKKNSNLTAQYNELKKFLDKQVSFSKKSSSENSSKSDENKKSEEKKDSSSQNNSSGEKQENKSNSEKSPQGNGKKQIKHGGKLETGSRKESSQAPSIKVTPQNDSKINQDIIKPESTAEALRKGYMPLRQYSLFDDENK